MKLGWSLRTSVRFGSPIRGRLRGLDGISRDFCDLLGIPSRAARFPRSPKAVVADLGSYEQTGRRITQLKNRQHGVHPALMCDDVAFGPLQNFLFAPLTLANANGYGRTSGWSSTTGGQS